MNLSASVRRTATATLVVVAALLAAPATAPAETSCLFAFGVVQVNLTANLDRADLLVASDGEIVVVGSNGQVLCSGSAGRPRVSNTDLIQVRTSPQPGGNRVTIHEANRFIPGTNREGEGGGDPEIEINVNLSNGPISRLIVTTDSSGGSLRVGSGGINLNATPGESVPDADISLTQVRAGGLSLLGNNGPDTLGAQGGAGTGDARGDHVSLDGGGGNDFLSGGGGPDVVSGAFGNDTLVDGGGRDDDTMDGGPGVDRADYDGPLAGVSIDLGIAGPQRTGAGTDSLANVEDVRGSSAADVLRGDGGPNTLSGRQGADVLLGRGGQDTLEGAEDADFLDVRDGGADTADCGSEIDSVTADRQGTDKLAGCENVLFGPVIGGGATGSRSGSGGGPGPGATADMVALRFVGRVRAVPARFRVQRTGTSFRYALSEAATVTFTIQRRGRGRRWRRIGAFRTRAAAGVNRTRFNGRLRRKKLKPDLYRVMVRAVDDAGNASRRARVRLKVLPPVR